MQVHACALKRIWRPSGPLYKWRLDLNNSTYTSKALVNEDTLLRTQNVSEQNQKHFLCPGHKICVRNKCTRGQTGKHLCRQQCVRNNVSSFARASKLRIHVKILRLET